MNYGDVLKKLFDEFAKQDAPVIELKLGDSLVTLAPLRGAYRRVWIEYSADNTAQDGETTLRLIYGEHAARNPLGRPSASICMELRAVLSFGHGARSSLGREKLIATYPPIFNRKNDSRGRNVRTIAILRTRLEQLLPHTRPAVKRRSAIKEVLT